MGRIGARAGEADHQHRDGHQAGEQGDLDRDVDHHQDGIGVRDPGGDRGHPVAQAGQTEGCVVEGLGPRRRAVAPVEAGLGQAVVGQIEHRAGRLGSVEPGERPDQGAGTSHPAGEPAGALPMARALMVDVVADRPRHAAALRRASRQILRARRSAPSPPRGRPPLRRRGLARSTKAMSLTQPSGSIAARSASVRPSARQAASRSGPVVPAQASPKGRAPGDHRLPMARCGEEIGQAARGRRPPGAPSRSPCRPEPGRRRGRRPAPTPRDSGAGGRRPPGRGRPGRCPRRSEWPAVRRRGGRARPASARLAPVWSPCLGARDREAADRAHPRSGGRRPSTARSAHEGLRAPDRVPPPGRSPGARRRSRRPRAPGDWPRSQFRGTRASASVVSRAPSGHPSSSSQAAPASSAILRAVPTWASAASSRASISRIARVGTAPAASIARTAATVPSVQLLATIRTRRRRVRRDAVLDRERARAGAAGTTHLVAGGNADDRLRNRLHGQACTPAARRIRGAATGGSSCAASADA